MHAHNVYLCGWRKCQRAFFVLLLLLLVSNIKLYICSLLFWIHSPFSSQIITGAGKGTHGPKIEDMMSIPQLSTGDMLRAAVADKTEVGQKAEAIMKAGGLVSDDIVVGIIRDRIQAEDCKFGFILVRTLLCLRVQYWLFMKLSLILSWHTWTLRDLQLTNPPCLSILKP